MRKKTILGSFVNNYDVKCSFRVKKLKEEAYSALINFLPESRELYAYDDVEQLRLSGEGYKWLMYLPLNEKWCLTTFYNPENEIITWYFDISKGNFIDENDMPCTDDIFLDIVIMPDGKTITIDADELQEAFDKNEITLEDYNYAYKVHDEILKSKWNDVRFLVSLSNRLISEYN